MKTPLLLLLITSLCISTSVFANSHPDLQTSLHQQLAGHIYIPARLIDEDSLLLEIHFSITDDNRLLLEELKGGNKLLQRFLQQQLQEFIANPSGLSLSGQKFVLPLMIRK